MSPAPLFKDRADAGRVLAAKLVPILAGSNPLVLALPRGGIPVAFAVAHALKAPLDIFLVRKLGLPGHEELAIGAIASGGMRVLNRELIEELRLPEGLVDRVTAIERQELERRENLYRRDRRPIPAQGRTVVLIDDGLATGASMLAAARALRSQNPARIVVAVPVAASETCERLRPEVDDIVCAFTPEPFGAVGEWYDDFSQTSDKEVQTLLERARNELGTPPEL